MKLAELKNVGAFNGSLQKLKDNMSLGDVKEALRNSPITKAIDKDLRKQLSFASSYRRTNVELKGQTLSCQFELGQGQLMDVVFKMNHGQVIVASLTAPVQPEAEDAPK